MSEPTPPPPPQRRNWTLPIVAGVLALVVVAVVCVGGSVMTYLALRKPDTPPAPTPAPTTASTPTPPPTAPKTNAECLIGDWLETSHVSTAEIFGTRVQLYSKGTVHRFGSDGVSTTVYDNLVHAGQANGSNYEVIHNGKIVLNYLADETNLHYSNPKVEGTTTWKVDGKVRDTEPMQVLLTPETYKCSGDQLRIYGDQYAIEYQRIRPPGVPV